MIRTVAFFLIVISLVIVPLAFHYQGGLYLYSPVKIAAVAALGLVLLALAFTERRLDSKQLMPADVADGLALFLLAWLGVAALGAVNGWIAFMTWAQWAAAIGAFWFIRRTELRPGVVAALIAGGVLVVLVGYAQLEGWGPAQAVDQYGERLPTSTFGQANYAAQAVLPVFIAGFALALGASRIWIALCGVALAAVALPYLYLTQSRGAWLAALAGVCVLLAAAFVRRSWGMRRRATMLAAGSLVLVAGALLSSGSLKTRLADAFDSGSASTAIRLSLWRDSVPIVAEFPLLGFGPGQFLFQFTGHWSEETAKRVFAGGRHLVENPHNDWLALALAGGLPALAAFVALLALVLVGAWRGPWRHRPPGAAALIALGVTAAWAAYGFVDYPLHNPLPVLGFFALLGVLAPVHPADDGGRLQPSRAVLILAVAAWLAVLLLVPAMIRTVPAQAHALKAVQHLAVNPQQAIDTALKAVDLDERNALAFTVIGQAKLAMGAADGDRIDHEGAAHFLRRALELFPNDFTARYNLGVALHERALDLGEPLLDARKEFRRALAINPYYGKAYFQLASIEARENGTWPRVKRNLDRALKLDPPLFLVAGQAPEFTPYRRQPGWDTWYDGLRRTLNIRHTR